MVDMHVPFLFGVLGRAGAAGLDLPIVGANMILDLGRLALIGPDRLTEETYQAMHLVHDGQDVEILWGWTRSIRVVVGRRHSRRQIVVPLLLLGHIENVVSYQPVSIDLSDYHGRQLDVPAIRASQWSFASSDGPT